MSDKREAVEQLKLAAIQRRALEYAMKRTALLREVVTSRRAALGKQEQSDG